MVGVQFPGLDGVLPDYGRFTRSTGGSASSSKHEATALVGSRTSPATFGHFGGAGTFLWVDPDGGVACAALTTRDFGDWAKEAWPRFSDAVLAELRRRARALAPARVRERADGTSTRTSPRRSSRRRTAPSP